MVTKSTATRSVSTLMLAHRCTLGGSIEVRLKNHSATANGLVGFNFRSVMLEPVVI